MIKRFLLADDNDIARRLLAELTASRPEWLVCAEAADGFEAVEMAASSQPDFAILDLQMPRLNGIDAARQIIALLPDIPVLLISSHDPDLIISEIKSTQIRGFVSKDALALELFLAIDTLLAGGSYFPSPKQRDDGEDVKPSGAPEQGIN